MFRQVLAATAAIGLFLGAPAMAQDTTPQPSPQEPTVSDQDQPPPPVVSANSPQEFASMAAVANMFEIQSSEIALEKTQEQAVRDFAQRMIDDHTAASQEMMAAAEQEGVADIPQSLDQRHQGMITQLQDASADQFDNLYVQMQTSAHEEAVALFESYAGQEGALADFAEETLPTLQEHLNMVRDLPQQ